MQRGKIFRPSLQRAVARGSRGSTTSTSTPLQAGGRRELPATRLAGWRQELSPATPVARPLASPATGVATPWRLDPVFGCHLWSGRVDRDGYGRTSAWKLAHHAAAGPPPSGYEWDHLCRRRSCVNPLHLQAVDRSENERRKSFRYRQRRISACPAGHSLVDAMVTPEGGRVCRECLAHERRGHG